MASYILRIEATNLANFIFDNDDLSTLRGAGLLLLNTKRFLCGESDDGIRKAQPGLLHGAGPTYAISDLQVSLISSGASITVFSFEATEERAHWLRGEVGKWLRSHTQLRYATFAVETIPNKQDFGRASEQVLMQVRRAQMRAPNVSFGAIRDGTQAGFVENFCDIDHKRARAINLKDQPRNKDGSSYAKAPDKNFSSLATDVRRSYGRWTKVSVYQMVGELRGDVADFTPSWEFEEIARRDNWRSAGDVDIDGSDPYGDAKDKMAVIYIDGNKFGGLIRRLAKSAEEYAELDAVILKYRRELMSDLVKEIKGKPSWLVCPPNEDENRLRAAGKARIETLLWGGDELIWVVPAWHALEAVKFFFEKSQSWVLGGKSLTHAVGMVICSHTAPIRAVASLARELAESVKDNLQRYGHEAIARGEQSIAEVKGCDTAATDIEFQHLPTGNAMAYEVLESYDHLGRDFLAARADRRLPEKPETDAILTAEGLKQIVSHLRELKQGTKKTPKLPKSRLHQIVRTLRRVPPDSRERDANLEQTAYDKLADRIVSTTSGDTSFKALLNDTLHWKNVNMVPAKWFHLMELWDYEGSTPTSPLVPDESLAENAVEMDSQVNTSPGKERV